MIKREVLKAVAKVGSKSAEKSTGILCMFWLHQPKMPKCVQELRKNK